jgi:hypothetical protein
MTNALRAWCHINTHDGTSRVVVAKRGKCWLYTCTASHIPTHLSFISPLPLPLSHHHTAHYLVLFSIVLILVLVLPIVVVLRVFHAVHK